jgi:hypothetical protein
LALTVQYRANTAAFLDFVKVIFELSGFLFELANMPDNPESQTE